MNVKNFISDDGSLWSIRAVDISGNYGQRLLFDSSGNAIIRTGNIDRLTIGNTGAWNVQGGMTYNNVSNTLTATTFSGSLNGNATTATSSTNIAGGLGGQIPYQSAANTTALLANGTAGQVLTSAGTTLAPTWATPAVSNVKADGGTAVGPLTTTSAAYVALGGSLTITTGTSVIVSLSSLMGNPFGAAGIDQTFMSFSVSGATTLAASDTRSIQGRYSGSSTIQFSTNRTFKLTGLNAGSNTFTLQYRVTSPNPNGGYFSYNDIVVYVL
jgi:hypothetical protein